MVAHSRDSAPIGLGENRLDFRRLEIARRGCRFPLERYGQNLCALRDIFRIPVRHEAEEAADRGEPAVTRADRGPAPMRSAEHTSELQSLMRISYAVFCLKKKNKTI